VTTAFAEYLSDFEHIEDGRASRWSRALRDFQAVLEAASKQYNASVDTIVSLLGFPDDSEAKLFEDTSYLKDSAASIRFQSIPVPGAACRFLDMNKFFQNEINAQCKLYEVTADFKRGGADYLDVVQTEVVAALEELGDVKKCKTINDCVGLVPASVLKPI
jgi:uncharacterized Fe-S radical SAM superfamily protein PflX